MSKGLEALERIKENCDLLDNGYQWDETFSKAFDEDIDIIEKAIKIRFLDKGITMSKETEALETLCDLANTGDLKFQEKFNVFYRGAKVEELRSILEPVFKALELIKKYPFEVASVVSQPTYKDYCGWFASLKDGKPTLTQEEYELLKEVLL